MMIKPLRPSRAARLPANLCGGCKAAITEMRADHAKLYDDEFINRILVEFRFRYSVKSSDYSSLAEFQKLSGAIITGNVPEFAASYPELNLLALKSQIKLF